MKQTGKDPEQELLKIWKQEAEAEALINKINERYQEAVEGRLIRSDMEKIRAAVKTMAQAAAASIVREKNRLQTVTIHKDPTTKGVIVTIQPVPQEAETQRAIAEIQDILELARISSHPGGI